jgi:hypothetical protein
MSIAAKLYKPPRCMACEWLIHPIDAQQVREFLLYLDKRSWA